ncbi:MAG: ABC transporter permease [Armatimonadota bacterium]|nr:ABC transporter permease [Armatimonadota bacterium]MDR7505839.1 ABC transporter permease [Armatimonadota bacterium]MDR7546227.1 ABC transporter permease [Armatimonadota bacterium]MDR7553737.1 ABC transporter permease [Armatimonadota bacterium]MDR7559291.1 ABC transporter permease [Armatimonadota bacterium]
MPAPGAAVRRPPTVWRRLRANPSALLGLVVIGLVVVLALLAPWVAPYDPAEQFFDGLTLEGRPLPPNARFYLGTDLLGRDLLSRLIYGARVSLLIGVAANVAALSIGTAIGTVAGYFRGWTATVFMRFTDLMMAFPALILAIALAAILRPSLWIVALVIGMVNWVWIARVVYSQVLAISGREFIDAARALGVPTPRIFWRHLFPHLLPTLLVWGTLGISTTVMFEAALSFLGVGVRPPTPSWGGAINESQSYFLEAPWLVAFPGAAILLTSLAFNLVGDALRDALDPTLRGRR